MDITDDMLQAAVRKAIEAGLLPRNACREDAQGSKELIRLIVQAALSTGAHKAFLNDNPTLGRRPANPAYSAARDVKRSMPIPACG